ncbi:ATP-binding cassette sub-family A member 8-A [Heterocephalus glaber]|uniref:ATP-binding cassette sub-family A member 8-A n=1 Tax=Heterocephalus glaber TaxID=10181 RepID=G5B0B9_HETGA|nr:ATP-binding cassette sub-family A member 8-A [Heterocephalus glaber]
MPPVDLGRIDSFNDSAFVIAYTPFNKTTQRIMNKVSSASFMTGRKVIAFPDEENMTELISTHYEDVVRVIFTSPFSYHLKFLRGSRIPIIKEHQDHSVHCHEVRDSFDCGISQFWTEGFVALQAAINAAIIEISTNHSVMEELMSVTGKHMKIDPFIGQEGKITDFFICICIICFSPFTYYVSLSVTRERKKMKCLMTMMGLQDPAFWFSWGLLYAGFVFILTLFLAFIIKSVQFVILAGFMVVFSLFFFYGLSLIALAFLMSILLKKPFLTGLVVFLLTVTWGGLGFVALYRYLPVSLEWILSFFSPFAFTLGMAQLLHLEFDMNSNADSMGDPNLIIATIFMLFLDSLFYLALTFYFEKILPNEYGHRHSPLFFLKSSFWCQKKTANHVALENETESEFSDEAFEPVSTEFHGKEAIRIRNLTKEYRRKPKNVEALKGWVTIYNNKLSEITDLENISELTGVCPQSNVQFDFLTVKENLRLFAKIKGIQPNEVDNEVHRVLQELEMKNIQDTLAQNLSGGQKRKLTFGIAILGDPQIFLLDEPTAGLDPFSRHRVWNFLKERKAGHVILFGTQFMDEADILADRKLFLSKGKLKCAGSSLFLKKKWGIGYHLSLQLNETCVHERITSLVKHHIPDAKLSAENEGKLIYILPLERTNKFPDLYRDLESCPDLGIENYGVSMTTLNEVFLKLEGKSDIDQPDLCALGDVEAEGPRETGRLFEMGETVSSLSGMSETQAGLALLWQQVCAIARVRFLKIKHERKALFILILIFGSGLLHILAANAHKIFYPEDYCWDLSPHMYFLTPDQQPQKLLSNLLIINKTGASIDDFIHSLEKQNIALEVDAFGTRNGTEELSYNGAIIVSGNGKNYSFSLSCNTKRLNCFPVLVDIVSNGLLGMLSPSGSIHTDRSTYPDVDDIYSQFNNLAYLISWIVLMSCLSPYISMTSIDDYKNKAQLQLWISGLNPSAYWFGQALVEVPIYFSLIFFMYLVYYTSKVKGDIYTAVDVLIEVTLVSAAVMGDFLGDIFLYCVSALIPFATLVGCTMLHFDKPAIIASCLRKEYTEKKCLFFKRKKKTATRNVSFCVRKGEVLGLLGHNGAGKSTSIRMITGETKPSAGQVLLRGSSSPEPQGFLGYCPQENVLWPSLTVREHLQVFAAVKGLRKGDAEVAVTRLVEAFKLQDQLQAPVRTLSEGMKRKLCFVLSILGNPSVVLLDEPSTGMDPEGQQQIWKAIRATLRDTERGVLLTTHYMAEAEAVCDRVAIMVSGRLRCIGSIQHLKSKFGKDYLLEMKVKTPTQVEPLHAEILRLFPQAARQERYSSLMVYKLPVEDVQPLSRAFFKLETVKQSFDMEEYSLSQSTLEQVFLELSKEQEMDDFDEELDPSVKWKLLPQEEP